MSLKAASDADVDEEQSCVDAQPAPGAIVFTACGGRINYSADVPCALFRGKPLYFCLPICKEDYEEDPFTSCLVSRLLDSDAQ